MGQVNACLGIRTDINNESNSTGTVFTDDVLKIEIRSPKEDYLTIIDVPGIFRNPQGVTTKSDIEMVRKMVENYIKDRRTIILAVLPSNVDIATQEILSLAEDHDPKGERTLGVLTKPDIVKERSGKNVVCNLVLGKKKPLTLGYYVVCNRGADDDDVYKTPEQRELMFNEAPWNTLPRERVGIAALKAQLTQLLSEITKREFIPLRQEVIELQRKNEHDLGALGSPRETETEQRTYLSSIAGKFQTLVTSAVMGHYVQDDAFDKNPELRLSTIIVNRADDLVTEFGEKGHEWKFATKKNQTKLEDVKESSASLVAAMIPQDLNGVIGSDFSVISNSSEDTNASSFLEDDGLSDFLHSLPDFNNPQIGIEDWIKDIYKRNRGPELCSFGGSILCSAFKEQSSRWEDFAKAYVSDCIGAIHAFIRRALNLLCPSGLDDEIWSFLADEVIGRYKASLEKAVFLTNVERNLKPYTLNHDYSSEVNKARSIRLGEALRSGSRASPHSENVITIDLSSIDQFSDQKASIDHFKDEIHDALESYYKVAAERFLDNLYMQAVDYCLMNGNDTPLKVFSQEWVIGLSSDQLEMLVGDSHKTRAQRDTLKRRREDLAKAMKILRG